ncbi:MAG TPA: GTP cyclohydrolase II [Polyangiaceae bacterium]
MSLSAEWTSRAGDVDLAAEAPLPTRHGEFRTIVFRHRHDPQKEHVALVKGDVRGDQVLTRIHSECLTGEVLGSLKCDCAPQLEGALERIAALGRGLVVYLRQEGRGIGLANKVRAYALQARGFDTVDANLALHLPEDARRYDAAAALLERLGVSGVRLLTNNPEKVRALSALGIPVRERVPHVVDAHPLAQAYLETKRLRMQHALPQNLGDPS